MQQILNNINYIQQERNRMREKINKVNNKKKKNKRIADGS